MVGLRGANRSRKLFKKKISLLIESYNKSKLKQFKQYLIELPFYILESNNLAVDIT